MVMLFVELLSFVYGRKCCTFADNLISKVDEEKQIL